MIRGVLFDMDGLMFDTEPIAKACWAELGSAYGCTMDEEFYRSLCGLNRKAVERRFKEKFGEGLDFASYSAAQQRLLLRRYREDGVPMKPGLMALLRFLQERHIPAAVATSSGRERTEVCLRSTGMEPYLSAVLCGDMVAQGKPHPEIYERAAALLGLPPGDCLALEDSANGIRSAHGAGCRAVMVPDMIPPTPELLSLCFAQVDSLEQVIPIIEGELDY